VLGQVQHDLAAAAAGDPGGDGEEVPAQRAGAGVAVVTGGQRAGGAQQVVGDRCAGQPAFAVKIPEGRWASGPFFSSASTCSMIAWPRWSDSAVSIGNGLSVNTAWYRQAGVSSVCPGGASWRTRRTISRAVIAWWRREANAV